MSDDYGLVIRNNNNQIVIDSRFRNYSFQSTGVVAVSKTLTGGFTTASITNTSDAIVGVMKPGADYARLMGFVYSGGEYTDIIFASDSAQNIAFAYYTESLKNSLPNYGMIVYDSSASVVWSSGEDGYFNIIDVHDWDISPYVSISAPSCVTQGVKGPTAYTDITVEDADDNWFHMSGFPYAYAQCRYYSNENCPAVIDHAETYLWMAGMKKIDSTTIRIGWFYYKHPSTSKIGGPGCPTPPIVVTSQGTGGSGTGEGLALIEVKAPPA